MKKILFLTVMIFVLCGFKCNKKGNDPNYPPADKIIKQTTTAGVHIGSVSGRVTRVEMDTIDNSLNVLFADARALGYQNWLGFGQYGILVKEDCTPSPEQHVMSFRVEGHYPPPFGKFDANGNEYVLAAEQVDYASDGTTPTGNYVICRDNLPTMALTARYGVEHIILFFNNPTEYSRTQIHTDASNSHPLIPSARPQLRKPILTGEYVR